MGSRFYFGASDDSGSEFDGNDSNLPFPKPLSRAAFLEPNFDPAAFLASLSDRYQTLEDLRNELRELSQSLSKELLDLVNNNYQDFLSLGSTLRGGEDRIEEVQVGLLGFQRDLTAVRENVEQRRETVATLIEEKRSLMKQVRNGKSLLEIEDRIEDLEASLMISATTNGSFEEVEVQSQDLVDSDDDTEDGGIVIRPLERHVEQYLILQLFMRRHNPKQPYILSQFDRTAEIKSTLSLDLGGALKHFKSSQKDQPVHTLMIDRLAELLRLVDTEQQSNAGPDRV